MPPFIRTFLAIDLPDPIKEEILEVIGKYRELTKSGIKWVNRENLHITLKFLGRFSTNHVSILEECLRSGLERISAFDLRIDQLGAFPNINRPKVIWMGFKRHANLDRVFAEIESCSQKLGYEKEDRPFFPHLTLGRISRNASLDMFTV